MVIGQLLGVERVVLHFSQKESEVARVLRTEVRDLAIMLMGYVKADKLSGEVLHVQSGRLRRSITSRVEGAGPLVAGVVGTNVVYAAAHEFGIDQIKDCTVHAYLRKCKSRNVYAMKKGRYFSLSGAAAKVKLVAEGVAFVHEYTRHQHIKLPERSFLRSSLRELGPDIRADLLAAIEGALR